MNPLELLQLELDKYQRALQKSKDSFALDLIPKIVHKEHVTNLEPKIQEYKDAIHCLKIFGK